MTKLTVEFGDIQREARVSGSGRLRFFIKLSPSFALFALDLEYEIDYGKYFRLDKDVEDQEGRTKILDIILTRKDGWTKDVMDDVMANIASGNPTITVSGFPERRRDNSKGNANIFCIHASEINFMETGKIFKAEPRMENSVISESTKTAVTSPIIKAPPANVETNLNTNNGNAFETGSPAENGRHGHTKKKTCKRMKNSDRGANDNSRFPKLVFFLLSEFGGYDALSALPVVDVAGGSGGLAFELVFKHQIPCTVVDTRPVQFSKAQKNHLKFKKQSYNALLSIKEKSTPLVENLKTRFQVGVSDDDGLLRQLQTLLETEAVLKGLPSSKIRKRSDFVEANEELRNLLVDKRCSVLVGLHPDQATDPIMDVGFALKLPWVVIPCCVFPNMFKQRQLKSSGKPVRTYDDLCEYILQQHPDVKETCLPFRGRNRVFYWKPSKDQRETSTV